MFAAIRSLEVRLAATFLLLLISPAVFAQTTAAIVGNVTDSTGAVVPKCSIQVRNELTGQTRTYIAIPRYWALGMGRIR